MFFQLMIAILLGLAHPTHVKCNNNGTVVTTNDAGDEDPVDGDTPDDGNGTGSGGGSTGGEGGQINPPR